MYSLNEKIVSDCKLSLLFEFNEYNGFMDLEIVVNEQHFKVTPDNPRFEADIKLPTQVKLIVSGKNSNDTKIDANHNILADKSIMLIHAELDMFALNEIFKDNKVVLHTHNNQIVYGPYFGFNGYVNLDFNKNSVLEQVLHCNKDLGYVPEGYVPEGYVPEEN